MEDLKNFLVVLQVSGVRFLRDPTYRLLHVQAPALAQKGVLRIVTVLSCRPEARGPLLLLQTQGGDPWVSGRDSIREKYLNWQETSVSDGWPPLPEAPVGEGLVLFAEQLGQLVHARPNRECEILIALALDSNSLELPWLSALKHFINSTLLRSVRWLLLESVASPVQTRQSLDVPTLVVVPTSSEGGPKSAPPMRFFPVGAQGDISIPPRKGLAPPPNQEDDPSLLSITAMMEREGAETIRHLCAARDKARREGSLPQKVLTEIVLGSHLMNIGTKTQALSSYERALTAAEGDTTLYLVAALALGSSHLVYKNKHAALSVLANAISRAKTEAPSLTAEACRISGNIALDLGMKSHAIAFWTHAMICGRADPALNGSRTLQECQNLLTKHRAVVPEEEATDLMTPAELASLHAWSESASKEISETAVLEGVNHVPVKRSKGHTVVRDPEDLKGIRGKAVKHV